MISRAQQGAVLIMMLCAVMMVMSVGLLGGRMAGISVNSDSAQVQESLARAKEALISFAVNYTDNYGHNTRGGVGRLPCPAKTRHSSPALNCGKNAIGMLPAVWNRDGKRIDIDFREYFLEQDLWYALSADFRYNPSYNHLNPDAGNYLQLNNQEEIVAVVIHPGEALNDQHRDGQTLSVADFLEGENADQDMRFAISAQSNDRLISISRADLMPLIERRVLGIAKDWLQEFFDENGYFPYAARLGDPLAACEEGLTNGIIAMTPGNCTAPVLGDLEGSLIPHGRMVRKTWFGIYQWPLFIYYQVNQNCTVGVAPTYCGHPGGLHQQLKVNGKTASVLLVSTGRAIESEYLGSMQDREGQSNMLASYLDTESLLVSTHEFDFSHLVSGNGLASNDQYLVMP